MNKSLELRVFRNETFNERRSRWRKIMKFAKSGLPTMNEWKNIISKAFDKFMQE